MRAVWFFSIIFLACLPVYGDGPASRSSDPTVDWLLSQAATAPAASTIDVSSTQPTDAGSVFNPLPGAREEFRTGSVTLSDGRTIKGELSTTLRQPLHVWVESEKQFEDVPFSLIRSIDVRVISEEQTKEWNFAASGSDIKQYSGRTYPVRVTEYDIKLDDGTTVSGSVAAPIYVDAAGARHGYILHKTEKGEVGQAMKDMIYVKSVDFSE